MSKAPTDKTKLPKSLKKTESTERYHKNDKIFIATRRGKSKARELAIESSSAEELNNKIKTLTINGMDALIDKFNRLQPDQKMAIERILDISEISDSSDLFQKIHCLLDNFQAKTDPVHGDIPDKAPALWEKRDRHLYRSPVHFIEENYGRWIGKGLSRSDLRNLDLPLYNAYASWIRPNRHPSDKLDALEPHDSAECAKKVLQRRREGDRRRSAQYRERQGQGHQPQ